MIITLKDKTEIYVTKEQGNKIEEALINGTAPDFIKLSEITFRTDWIVKLEQGGYSKEENNCKKIEAPVNKPEDTKLIRRFIKEHISSDPTKLKDVAYRSEWILNQSEDIQN